MNHSIASLMQKDEGRKRGTTMQIIINIPKETYIHLLNGGSIGASLMIENALKNGTPLPKGHGKIVDANRVLENGDNWEVETALMQTEAIIEADESEVEE